jgi:hypothetical protein
MRTRSAFLTLAALTLAACTATTHPVTPPAPAIAPQVQVLQYAQLATAAGDTAAHVLVALCTSKPPVIDLTTCNTVKSDLIQIKNVVDQIVVEANKVPAIEPWTTARINIGLIAASAAVHATVQDATLQSDLTGLLSIVRQQIVGVQ